MTTVAVIGAGVTGLTTAYELLDRGFEVTVFDRHRYAAMETSFANGGQLSASNAETWTQWGTVLKGLKWMLQADAPLLVNPAPTLHKIALDGRVPVEHPELQGEHRRDRAAGDRRARGALRDGGARGHRLRPRAARHPALLLDGQKDLAHARMVNGLLAEGGLERRELSPDEIRAIEPALHGDFVGGFLTESDSSGDIHKFTVGPRRGPAPGAAPTCASAPRSTASRRSSGGVRISVGRRARRRSTASWSRPASAAAAIAQALGDRVNIYPVKGYSITVAPRRRPRARRRRPGSACSTTGRRSSPAASARTASASPAPPSSTAPTATSAPTASGRWSNGARSTSPAISTEHATPWAGLRPMTPSMLPRVGRGRKPGRLLQHRPRPPRLDPVGRDRPDRRRAGRRGARSQALRGERPPRAPSAGRLRAGGAIAAPPHSQRQITGG